MNVLIVEDERQLSHEIEIFLMQQGYHCDVAFTGKSASEKVFVNTYDFVLLDTRGREPFANGHIPGAWCAPEEELERIATLLPTDREIVTYCWSHD